MSDGTLDFGYGNWNGWKLAWAARTFRYSLVRSGAAKRVTLALIPTTGKPMNISLGIDVRQDDDPDLGALRDRLAKSFATKMEDVLKRRNAVEWIQPGTAYSVAYRGLSINPDGFTVENGASKTKLAVADVAIEIYNAHFFIKQKKDGKIAYQCPLLAPNFYPGMELLQRLGRVA